MGASATWNNFNAEGMLTRNLVCRSNQSEIDGTEMFIFTVLIAEGPFIYSAYNH